LVSRLWSIDFSAEVNLDPDPLPHEGSDPYLPEADDGPITTAVEIEVAPENHVRFFKLMKEIRLVFLRNGAFNARPGHGKPQSIPFICNGRLVGRE
jgi:hypothetical protein